MATRGRSCNGGDYDVGAIITSGRSSSPFSFASFKWEKIREKKKQTFHQSSLILLMAEILYRLAAMYKTMCLCKFKEVNIHI